MHPNEEHDERARGLAPQRGREAAAVGEQLLQLQDGGEVRHQLRRDALACDRLSPAVCDVICDIRQDDLRYSLRLCATFGGIYSRSDYKLHPLPPGN